MKLVIEDTDAIFGQVLDLLFKDAHASVGGPQRDWIEEQAKEPVAPQDFPPEQAATTAPAPPSTDTAGIPWDRRIHAESKLLNRNGTWRYRRGVGEALINRVEAEYKQAAAAPEPLPVPPPPPPPVTFADAMSLMAKQVASGKTTAEAVNAYCKSIGVPNLIAMSARPDLVPGFNEWLSKL